MGVLKSLPLCFPGNSAREAYIGTLTSISNSTYEPRAMLKEPAVHKLDTRTTLPMCMSLVAFSYLVRGQHGRTMIYIISSLKPVSHAVPLC